MKKIINEVIEELKRDILSIDFNKELPGNQVTIKNICLKKEIK